LDIENYLKERGRLVEDELTLLLKLRTDLFVSLTDSMRYSVFAGGKRIRPILAMAACEAVGGLARDVIPFACALELIHTYTLIHDDLPCMDNDDFRRGMPTNHKVFGEAQALLAGCSLLSLAFEIISRQAIDGGIAEDRALIAMNILAGAIGWQGVMGGQSIDMESTGKDADLSRVREICHYKTATLIEASVKAGAVIGGGHELQIQALEKYGEYIGLAFQVADDILNVEGDSQKLGKGTGTDAHAGKTTFSVILGVEGAKNLASKLLQDALYAINDFGPAGDRLRAIAEYMVNRDR
jgi:geranylgeranyl diphosphate synthase, type II